MTTSIFKTFFWALGLSLIHCVGHSQSLKVTAGPIVDQNEIMKEIGISNLASARKGFSFTQFFNPSKRTTYTGFGLQNEAFHFAALENYVNYTSVKQLTSEAINQKVRIHSFEVIDNQMYVLFSEDFETYDAFTLYVNEVDDNMVVLGSPIKVHSFENLKKQGQQILITRSENKKYRLITRVHEVKSKENVKLTMKLIDESFAEVWSRELETPTLKKDTRTYSIQIDNAGNAYVHFDDLSGKKNQPRLLSYFWKTNSLKTSTLGLTLGKNYNSKLQVVNGEKACVVGLNKNGYTVTYFMDVLNATTQQIEHLSEHEMSDEFDQVSTFRMFTIKDWTVRNIIALEDNSIVASVEASKLNTKYHIVQNFNTYLFSINEFGQQNWARTIQKKQSTIMELEGHALVPAGNKTLVIYNDHQKNANLQLDDSEVEIFKAKDAAVMVQEIDQKGHAKKYPLFDDPELKGYILSQNTLSKIEKGTYYSNCLYIKGMLNMTSRPITFEVVK